MKKKGVLICGALLVLALCLGGYYLWQQEEQKSAKAAHEKEITLTIIDASTEDEFELYKGTTKTETDTLSAYLKELKENKEITLEYSDGQYGMYITGMGGAKIASENPSDQVYWVYDSENNQDCLKASFCDAADKVRINNGDTFTFRLEKMKNE